MTLVAQPVMPDRRPVLPDEIETVARTRHRVNSGSTILSRRQINWPAEFTITDDSINEEVDIGVTPFGAWTPFTPTLTAASVNPTMGSGATVTGNYVQLGRTVIWQARIQFGTGAAAGSGIYDMALPVESASFGSGAVAAGSMRDSSTGERRVVSAGLNGVTSVRLRMDGATVANTVSDSVPWTWADSDFITVSGSYQSAA